MQQKQVKIIGLELKQSLGIIKAHQLKFDENNNLIVFKGKVGAGKTTEQKALQLGTLGAKSLQDAELYGNIDTEIQLLDGEMNIWVGCKSNNAGKLKYVLYTKDNNDKIQQNPIIDGVKATPAEYLKLLQTKLTWRINEITSENPTIQRKILLELYQREFQKLGVIFDKKSPLYSESILGKIDAAIQKRDYLDMLRKQKGGIADDLKAQGIDPDRPDTCPDEVNIQELQDKKLQLQQNIAVIESEAKRHKEAILYEYEKKGQEIKNRILEYNRELEKRYKAIKLQEAAKDVEFDTVREQKEIIANALFRLQKYIKPDDYNYFYKVIEDIEAEKGKEIPEPDYISVITTDNITKITDIDTEKPLVKAFLEITAQYKQLRDEPLNIAEKQNQITSQITEIGIQIMQASEINKIVEAVDSFHNWRKANDEVSALKSKYQKLLLSIDTGVPGLKVQQDDKSNIFLVYNGEFNSAYFGNEKKEYRKVSSYSGTQKPIIALLIQNYLLSKKDKALRYMYIDNIPIDKQTRKVIENMCNQLNITIIMNITGDFSKETLSNGEYLIENGEIFFDAK